MRPRFVLALGFSMGLCLLPPAASHGQDEPPPSNWDEYQAAHSLSCVGPADSLAAPDFRRHRGFEYLFSGSRVRVRRSEPRSGGRIRLGVVSGIKELDPATRVALDGFLDRFQEAGIEGLLVGGDTAEHESDLEEIFPYLAARGWPTYVVIGNWESRTSFNRALRLTSKEHPNLINMGLARRVDAEGFDVISLGGYFDRAYVRGSGACLYRPEHVQSLAPLAKEADDPVVLLTHGPPRQAGKAAIDFVPGVGNVGDEELAKLIAEAAIPFGVHGHILEAGGWATDAKGKRLPAGKFHPALFLNPGAATTFPWKLNDGKTANGMAALLTLEGRTASYEVLRAPPPKRD